jgi:short-subunit dehydrogenase
MSSLSVGSGSLCTIVGMGPGVSAAVAGRFANQGFDIGMVGRSAARLAECAAELEKAAAPARAITAVADSGNAGALRAALAKVAEQAGRSVSVLVYNAYSPQQGLPSVLKPEELEASFRVNVTGALVAAQAVLPAMRAAGRGTILFTGGGLALEPYPPYAALAVGKAGIRSLALSLAGELEPMGIHVATVTICGFVKPGTYYDAARIAEVYWELHGETQGAFRSEVVFREG